MDIDDRRQVTLRTDLPNQPHDLARGLGIETGGGLIDQEQLGVLAQSACDIHLLALTVGERIGTFIRLVEHVDVLQQREGFINVSGWIASGKAAPERYVT